MESIGEKLKKIRLEKGISLGDAHKKTKIHLNILEAIEGDSLTNLSPVYLKGFIKIYCKFLGVDPQECLASCKESLAKEEHQAKSPSNKVTSIKLGTSPLLKKIKSIVLFVLIIIVFGLILFNLGKIIFSRRHANLKDKRLSPAIAAKYKKENKAKVKKVEATVPVSKSTTLEPKGAKENFSGISLGIRARENCWISLKVDGKIVFQRVLEKGRYESWQAKERIELSVGNAGAVELEVNSQVFSNLGRKGLAIKNILITKEGLKIAR